MGLARHPALRQRRTSNELDAVTVRSQPAFWLGVNCNISTVHRAGKRKSGDIKELLEKIEAIELTSDRELADSVLEVSIKVNREVVEELRGDGGMCQALLEIMEPEINKIKEIVKEDTKKNAILCAVKSFRVIFSDITW